MKICAGRVVELRGVHRSDEGDVVGDLAEVRQQLGDLGAALAVLANDTASRAAWESPLMKAKRSPLMNVSRECAGRCTSRSLGL